MQEHQEKWASEIPVVPNRRNSSLTNDGFEYAGQIDRQDWNHLHNIGVDRVILSTVLGVSERALAANDGQEKPPEETVA